MKNILLALLFWAAPAAGQSFSTSAMRPLGLGEAYRLAETRSEDLASQREGIRQLEEAARLVSASFRPSLDAAASWNKQQNSDAVSRAYLSGSYNLFSGMRDYISAKAAAARTGAAKLDLERARQELYAGTAQAYLGLLGAQQEAVIRTEQLGVTARRIAELEARAQIGRSRKSELAAARSQLAQDQASYLQAAADERLAQQTLKFMTGLAEDLAPSDFSLAREGDLGQYLELALRRPDLAAARKRLQTYDYLAEIQDRSLWPTVDLSAALYALKDPMPEPENRWDASVVLKVPLYTGGAAAAGRRSAYSARKAAELDVQRAEREALSEVRAAYDDHRFAILQTASLEEALKLASENAGYQQEDYKLGLVTNLDVLNALNTVLQTRLALSQAKIRRNGTLIRLETAAGLEAKQ